MNQVTETLKHEVYLQRLATEMVNKKLFPSLDAAYKAIRLILLDAEAISSPTKLNAVTREITKAVNESLQSGWDDVTKELEAVAVYDAGWNAAVLGAVAEQKLKVPGKGNITDYINKSLMSLTSGQTPKVGTWAEFVSENVSGYAAQVNNLVKAGYVNGATVGQMTSDVRQFNEGLGNQQAETLVRTGQLHYSQQARRAMAEDNSDIIDKEYPVVVFDNRRSITCSSIYINHKNGWPLGKSPVGYPPYHFQCRTIIIYGINGMGDPRGEMPAIAAGPDYPDDAAKKPVYRGKRDIGKFKIEQVRYGTNLDNFMKDQGFDYVADNIGTTKAKLLFDGKLSLARMADVYGKPLTIEQLKVKERAAFERAGLI